MRVQTETETVPCDLREVHIVASLAPEDVENLLELAAASTVFSSDALMAAEDMAWDCAYEGNDDACSFLQARVNESGRERLVGFICYGEIGNKPDNVELFGIAVDPEFQRLGIGSALVAEMERRVASRGGKRIFLETGADRALEKARLFYEANGFGQESRFNKHFIPSEGGLAYCLNVTAGGDEHYQ